MCLCVRERGTGKKGKETPSSGDMASPAVMFVNIFLRDLLQFELGAIRYGSKMILDNCFVGPRRSRVALSRSVGSMQTFKTVV